MDLAEDDLVPPHLSCLVRGRVNEYLQKRLDNPVFHSRLYVNEEEQWLGIKAEKARKPFPLSLATLLNLLNLSCYLWFVIAFIGCVRCFLFRVYIVIVIYYHYCYYILFLSVYFFAAFVVEV